MLKMEELKLFVAVVEAQSISSGADRLSLPKSNVSRRIKQLEESLGVKLIERTPRLFKLTEAGTSFYQGSIELLQNAESLTQKVSQQQTHPSGRLRICGPSALNLLMMKDSLVTFTDQYPDIQLEFLSSGIKRNIHEDNIDLLITINRPKDSSLIAMPLMEVRLRFYASPAYLEKNGAPQHPNELGHHRCLGSLNQDMERMPWRYLDNGSYKNLAINHHHYSDSGPISREMAEQGLGVVLLPDFICKQAEQAGRLVALFNGEIASIDEIYALYSSRTLLPTKTRVFLEHLREHHRNQL
jgi:DNA-binding transcriptional LysR family regulator